VRHGAWLTLGVSEARLFADLAALGIPYELVEHEAVFTVEQNSMFDRDIVGAHTKNLFLKDVAGQFWLVTVPAHCRVDLKKLPEAVGCKRLSFAKAEEMERLLGILPGSVTPLAAINDKDEAVKIILDVRLLVGGRVNVHPLRNTATIGLSPQDLISALRHWCHVPAIIMVPTTQ
jgi:Ala-tRNA(Pro) deacylase